MTYYDLSNIPFTGRLSDEEQKEFERRALIMDDPDDPPIVLDEEGNFIKDSD